MVLVAAAEPTNTDVNETQPKAPVIIDQPPERITAVVGKDLKLQLEVKGEQPLRYCMLRYRMMEKFAAFK